MTGTREPDAKDWLVRIKKMLDNNAVTPGDMAVEVRNTVWTTVGARAPFLGEYRIRLSSSVRICGTLGVHGEPQTAQMQVRQNGEHMNLELPWTNYPADESLLLAFAAHFYFGG